MGRLRVQRRQQLKQFLGRLLVHHLQRPLFATVLPPVKQEAGEHEGENRPSASLAMHHQHILLPFEGQPALAQPQEVVDDLQGKNRAAFVMARVAPGGDVVVGQDVGDVALHLALEIDDQEGSVGEMLSELENDLVYILVVIVFFHRFRRKTTIEH